MTVQQERKGIVAEARSAFSRGGQSLSFWLGSQAIPRPERTEKWQLIRVRISNIWSTHADFLHVAKYPFYKIPWHYTPKKGFLIDSMTGRRNNQWAKPVTKKQKKGEEYTCTISLPGSLFISHESSLSMMDENLPNVICIHVEYWIIFQIFFRKK